MVLCPRSDCRAELSNRRIDLCPDCHTARPGSVRSQLLKDRTPRLICQHCSTSEQPTLIFPKQVGDAFPLYHKGVLNVPSTCPNPFCQAKNPCTITLHRGKFANLLLVMGYWVLPLLALQFIFLFGLPESPNAALDRLAAAPWWYAPPGAYTTVGWLDKLEKAATPDLQQFALWVVKMLFFYGVICLNFWAALVPRAQVTRKAAISLAGFALSSRVIYIAFSVCFVLCCLLAPVVTFVPSTAPAMFVPVGFACVLAIALYLAPLLLLDFTLPLVQLATFSIYGVEVERFTRKCCQAFAFLRQWLGFNHELAPMPHIAALLVGTLLIKVYGLGGTMLILVGIGLGFCIAALVGAVASNLGVMLLFSLGILIAFPFIMGWQKLQTWYRSRPAKHP